MFAKPRAMKIIFVPFLNQAIKISLSYTVKQAILVHLFIYIFLSFRKMALTIFMNMTD